MSRSFLPTDFRLSCSFGRSETPHEFFEGDMALVEKRFKEFCQKKLGREPTIPNIIHFIWLGGPLPDKFKPYIDSWSHFHPVKLWTEKEESQLNWIHPWAKLLYEDAQNFAEKSDILRYEILFQHGGIYSDIDVFCLKPFDDLLTSGLSFFAGQETNQGPLYLCNAVLGSAKGHPILHFCLENIASQSMAPNQPIFSRTGQALLTRAAVPHLQNERLLVLPCSYFYPLPFFEDLSHKTFNFQDIQKKYLAPESMALHLWAATWYS